MGRIRRWRAARAAAAIWLAFAAPAAALPDETVEKVVSVLPVWPGQPAREGQAGPVKDGAPPEGSGVVIGPGGLIATAAHVVAPAERIEVRLADGRILPAALIGLDKATDVALLRIEAEAPYFAPSGAPRPADPVCAVGNAYGLGLSVSCGVVSATAVSAAGFNEIEDFVQTDAAANPGASGGALVDPQGRLVGMVSAIFAGGGDGNIGVNFAVSAPLLLRVAEDLSDDGAVSYVDAGWTLGPTPTSLRARIAGAEIRSVAAGGPAAAAGFEAGDLILKIGERRILKPRDAVAALALLRPGEAIEVASLRDARTQTRTISFPGVGAAEDAAPNDQGAAPAGAPCPHPEPVCAARQAVFPVSSFDPLASAVRIDEDLLVTNRHVVADRKLAAVMTPSGPVEAVVAPSSYLGDLALLRAEGLPEDWPILEPEEREGDGPFYAVGADPRLRETRVFAPGALLRPPGEGAPLGRLHVAALMRPGVSGGALVDAEGRLVGIAVGGGEGRYEAIPAGEIERLIDGAEDDNAAGVQAALGGAYRRCAEGIDALGRAPRGAPPPEALEETCLAANNLGQMLEAGRVFAQAGAIGPAIALHGAAADQAPNSVSARLSLLVSLQLAGRFEAMLPHAAWLAEAEPDDPQTLRFAIQAGVWGDDPGLAEAAYATLSAVDPRQAAAARRFIDQPPPAPPMR